jgi:hypothetical protein
LALAKFGHQRVVILNAFIKEEHPDNRRFLADCERWFGHPVTVLRDTKYGASAREVWRRKRFTKSAYGAPCSLLLKREVLDAACLPEDIHVLGFTAEEEKRAQRFLGTGAQCPLIERGLTKADCLAIVERAGIELPLMYRLGYNNANCIGCCKGGRGYWNKIRRDFPRDFNEVVQIEAAIGPSGYLLWDDDKKERYPLTELNPTQGRVDEILPDCSFFCAMAEEELADEQPRSGDA